MRRLHFLHIHKTAGTSLKRQLFQNLPADIMCPCDFEWQVRQLDPAELKRFAIFCGHISAAALPFAASELTQITMLREPRVRLLSALAFWKAIAPHNLNNAFFRAVAPLSLLEFLRDDSPIIRRATWNVQARLLAGGHFGPSNDLRTNVYGPDVDADQLVERAEIGLQSFALVGISERYAESLGLARDLLGLPGPRTPEAHNISGRSPEVYLRVMDDPDVAAALNERTEIDSAIYAAALRRLDRQLADAVQA